MPPDPPRDGGAHQVPWLVSTSRYAPDRQFSSIVGNSVAFLVLHNTIDVIIIRAYPNECDFNLQVHATMKLKLRDFAGYEIL